MNQKERELKAAHDEKARELSEVRAELRGAHSELLVLRALRAQQGGVVVPAMKQPLETVRVNRPLITEAVGAVARLEEQLDSVLKVLETGVLETTGTADELVALLGEKEVLNDLVTTLQDQVKGKDEDIKILREDLEKARTKVRRYELDGIFGRRPAERLLKELPSNWNDLTFNQWAMFPRAVWVLFRVFMAGFKQEVYARAYTLPEGSERKAALILNPKVAQPKNGLEALAAETDPQNPEPDAGGSPTEAVSGSPA